MPSVHNVVFDVGRVLIDFRYDDLFRLLRQHGAVISGEDEFAHKVGLIGYEQGEIDDDQFLERVNALLLQPLPNQDLIRIWNDIFTPVQPMLDLATRLKSACGVYLLSNTSPIHWRHLKQAYGLEEICHGLFASYEAGVMKPEADIFRQMESRFGLEAEKTLFIDDKKENVAGARACGWQGLWHQSPEATITAVEEMLGIS